VVSRLLIPVPFDQPPPENDHVVLIGDWYTKDHEVLARQIDAGKGVGRPAGVLINGKGGKDLEAAPAFTFEAGKTYRLRVCNTGIKASLNSRIQRRSHLPSSRVGDSEEGVLGGRHRADLGDAEEDG
jgi:L-ascorbate oxidase